MTSSNGKIFRVTGPLCGEFTGPGEFPTQRPVTRSFDVIFYLRLNKRLSKLPWGWWFETPSWSLWRHCNVFIILYLRYKTIKYTHNKKPKHQLQWNSYGPDFVSFCPFEACSVIGAIFGLYAKYCYDWPCHIDNQLHRWYWDSYNNDHFGIVKYQNHTANEKREFVIFSIISWPEM